MEEIREEFARLENGPEIRLTFKGQTKPYTSKRIPLNMLYYNDMNGRISTLIDEYQQKNGTNSLIELKDIDREQYNSTLASMIKDSAADHGASFKKTKEDIRKNGQKQIGVVLDDGRVIDGNRRFTCLRELSRDSENWDGRFGYFEAVVLPAPNTSDRNGWAEIKALEIDLQFKVDNPRDYDPIDRLASVYHDVLKPETKFFPTEASYYNARGITQKEFQSEKDVINVMLEYLEHIGKPERFYILKTEKLDGPMRELAKGKSAMGDAVWQRSKGDLFDICCLNRKGDLTREIRELVKSAKKGTGAFQKIQKRLDEEGLRTEIAINVANKYKTDETPEESEMNRIKRESVAFRLQQIRSDSANEAGEEKIEGEPLKKVGDAARDIDKINIRTVRLLPPFQKREFKKALVDLIKRLEEIKQTVDEYPS